MAIAFDAAQKKAVYADERPMLVLAGPGSGKTTVLVHRVAYLTVQKKIRPEEILVLTFTRASAAEMKSRYLKLIGSTGSPVTFGTFHSVFYAFLRQHGYLNYRVISREEELALTREAITEVMGICIVSNKTASDVLDAVGRIKNGMAVSESLPVQVYPLLREKMRKSGCIDYDDMLLLLYQLLAGDPELVCSLSSQYRYILIDEFQDINRIQYEIIKLLARPSDRVFAVGDDDQSIYGFRGSDPGYMQQFLRDFPRSHKVVLTANHRSGRKIVHASRRLIDHNKNRFLKRLVSRAPGSSSPVYLRFETVEEQALYLEKKIHILLAEAESGCMPADEHQAIHAHRKAERQKVMDFSIAVLARTLRSLEEAKEQVSPEIRDQIEWMTFHASKGLEFDAVFIIAAEEGITPDRRNLKGEALEEERRCFYVAVTRCKRYLHILYTKNHYNKPVERSRFISEMKLFL